MYTHACFSGIRDDSESIDAQRTRGLCISSSISLGCIPLISMCVLRPQLSFSLACVVCYIR